MAAFPNTPIQSTFRRYQERGQFGQLARLDNGSYLTILGIAGGQLLPGFAVYFDEPSNPGTLIRPTNDATAALVTHIVGYNPSDQNTQNVGIVYDISTPDVPVFVFATVFLKASGSINANSSLSPSTDGSLVRPNASLPGQKLRMIAVTSAEDGEIFPVRIDRVGVA